jgi:transcriptional regulator with XRE-family HTH domain
MILAKNIIRLCKEKGITVTQLARMAEISQPTLHGWTTGRSVKKVEDLKKIASVLEVSIHELLFGTPDPYESNAKRLEEIFSGDLRITIHKVGIK